MGKKILIVFCLTLSLWGCSNKEPVDGIYIGHSTSDELMIGDYDFVVKAYKIDDAQHIWIDNGKIKSSD